MQFYLLRTFVTVAEQGHLTKAATLVKAGLGLGLMRDDLADSAERSGNLFVWRKATARTTLSFVYLRGREKIPTIAALLDVVEELWQGSKKAAPGALRTVA